jgi:hypothetical protein
MWPGSWTGECFAGFEQAMQELAGPLAVDCGFNSEEAGLACARRALASGLPFRLGSGGIGIDSFICDVVARNSQGHVFLIDYDSDVTGRMGKSGENAALYVERCESVEIRGKWRRRSAPFSVAGCEEDKELVEMLVSRSQGREPAAEGQ